MRLALFLAFFIISSVSAIEVSISCPEEVILNEEFECEVISSEVQSPHDLKVELMSEGKTIARIYNLFEEKWTSAYYYLPEFITTSSTQEIHLKIEKEGTFTGTVKVRGTSPQVATTFDIQVGGESPKQTSPEEKTPPLDGQTTQDEVEIIKKTPKAIAFEEISLDSPSQVTRTVTEQDQVIYESKNERILNMAPYALSLFLLALLTAFLIKR